MENETNPLLEIIQNISQNLNNNNLNNISNNTLNNQTNNSNDLNIFDLINNFSNTNIQTNQNNTFDLSSLIKIQKIISALNEEDPRKNLLTSIKPFLRKSRQNKIDEYITYLSIISAIGIFNDKKE